MALISDLLCAQLGVFPAELRMRSGTQALGQIPAPLVSSYPLLFPLLGISSSI